MLPGFDPEYVEVFMPLLDPGMHPMSIADLRLLCVEDSRFDLSTSRAPLMDNLEEVLGRLQAVEIEGKVWIDGSFLTEKIDPDDVDLVVALTSTFIEAATPSQTTTIEWIYSNLYDTYKCHSFTFTTYPEGHPYYLDGVWNHDFWMTQWGFDRSNNPKGIAVLPLPKGSP